MRELRKVQTLWMKKMKSQQINLNYSLETMGFLGLKRSMTIIISHS